MIEEPAGDDGDGSLPYVKAFELIEEEGATPLDLVRHPDLEVSPAEARELVEEYNDLEGEFYLMERGAIEDLKREAFEEGLDRGRKEGEKRARQSTRRQVEAAREQAYNAGYSDALQQSQMLSQMRQMQDMAGSM